MCCFFQSAAAKVKGFTFLKSVVEEAYTLWQEQAPPPSVLAHKQQLTYNQAAQKSTLFFQSATAQRTCPQTVCKGKFARHLCLVLPPGFATFSLTFSIAAALVLEIKPTLLPPRIAEMPENPSRESLQKRVSCKKRHFAVKSEYEK